MSDHGKQNPEQVFGIESMEVSTMTSRVDSYRTVLQLPSAPPGTRKVDVWNPVARLPAKPDPTSPVAFPGTGAESTVNVDDMDSAREPEYVTLKVKAQKVAANVALGILILIAIQLAVFSVVALFKGGDFWLRYYPYLQAAGPIYVTLVVVCGAIATINSFSDRDITLPKVH